MDSVAPLVDVSDLAESEQEIGRLTRGLAAWAITQLTEISPKNAAAAVTDGFGDNGIDAVAIDHESSVVYVVQGKWSHKGTGSPAAGDVHKFIQGFRDLINAEFGQFNQKLQAKQPELESALDDPDVRFVLVIAHSGQDELSDQARHAIDELLKELNEPIDTASFEMLSQTELHGFLTRGIHGAPPDLKVTLYDWGSTQEPMPAAGSRGCRRRLVQQVRPAPVRQEHSAVPRRLRGERLDRRHAPGQARALLVPQQRHHRSLRAGGEGRDRRGQQEVGTVRVQGRVRRQRSANGRLHRRCGERIPASRSPTRA